ncbi:MAG: hypothetical protein Q8888_02385 [Vigna little leaf phytoplasma]|nr:hypothetical protein [Vigna little leaf phytoplasma]
MEQKTELEKLTDDLKNQLKLIKAELTTKQQIQEENQTKLTVLETQMKAKENELQTLQKEIETKNQLILTKEKELETTKNLSQAEKRKLEEEIKLLNEQIEKIKMNFEVKLQVQAEQINQIKAERDLNEAQIKKYQQEIESLRAKHQETLTQINKELAYYQNELIPQMEQEIEALTRQQAENKQQGEVLRQQLLAKQKQLAEINTKRVELENQKTNLEQIVNALIKWDEWEKATESFSYSKSNECYSVKPFKIRIRPDFKSDVDAKQNEEQSYLYQVTFKSVPININNKIVYGFKLYRTGNFLKLINPQTGEFIKGSNIYGIDTDQCNRIIGKEYNKYKTSDIYTIEEDDSSVPLSPTPPPGDLADYHDYQEKKQQLKEINAEITKQNKLIEQTNQEINNLIQQQNPDPKLQDIIDEKNRQVQALKQKTKLMELEKEKTEAKLKQSEVEKQALKVEYDFKLNQVIIDLKQAEAENKRLQEEIDQLETNLKNNQNTDQTLIKLLEMKTTDLKQKKQKCADLTKHKKELEEIIQQKDQEIQQLEKTIEEQVTEIKTLQEKNKELLSLYLKQSEQIQQLEGKIAGLEAANTALGGENQELKHQIELVKQQLAEEKDKHKETKEKLENAIRKEKIKKTELIKKQQELDEKTNQWKQKERDRISDTLYSNPMTLWMPNDWIENLIDEQMKK